MTQLNATIESLGIDGDGLAQCEGQKYYIPFTVPGDNVTFHTEKERRKTTLITDAIVPNTDLRAQPVCKHFGVCGGCKLQHLKADFYKNYKLGLLTRALDFHGVKAGVTSSLQIIPLYQRRRVSLHFRRRETGLVMGFMQRGTHWIEDIVQCHVIKPGMMGLIEAFKVFLNDFKPEGPLSGTLDMLDTTTGLDLNITSRDFVNMAPTQLEKLNVFLEAQDIAQFGVHERPIITRRVPTLVFAGKAVEASAAKFAQASDEADRFIEEQLLAHLPQGMARGVDLFSGRGTLTFVLAQRAAHVDAFENETRAIEALQRAAGPNVKAIRRDLFKDPLSVQELNTYDCIILDPPRAGALEQSKTIAASSVKNLAYVSCGPATFARDAQILCNEGGYILERVIPLDQFIYTEHLEVIAFFKKN